MPSVAEVQFKATGQQQVVSAFNSVGSSAGDATTKVNQNSSAMKTMGQGMKSSVSGIASAAGAFATLSLSVVNTWRAYRDLTDAQIAVDKANLKVKKTTEAIRKTEAEIAVIKKEDAKGSLESVATTNKIKLAQEKLNAAKKDGKHTTLELKVMQDNINLAMKEGSGVSKKLTDAENKLALQKESLGVQTDVAKEAQERFNDTQQNFYLSILPTALSGFASLSMAFSGLKGMFTGGGGLIGMFGPVGIALGAISLAIIAFKTNFLGLRDAVGGVITWFKERFGAWKDTIQEVFGFIQKGDWSGAFNRIKEAAISFWNDLTRSVWIFANVDKIVEKFAKGDWAGAFDEIRRAALIFWQDLKNTVWIFANVEKIIQEFAAGHWEKGFNEIRIAALVFWQDLVKQVPFLGDLATYLRTKLELASATAKAQFSLMARDLKGPIGEIQAGLAKLGGGDVVGGFGGIAKGVQDAIALAKKYFFDWVKLNFGIDLKTLETQAIGIGNTILTKIKEGLTFVARTWIDPIVTALLDPATWISAFTALGGALLSIGTALWNFIAGAIAGAAADPKGTGDWWGKIGQAIWDGITGWFKTNLPSASVAIENIAKAFTDAMVSSGIAFQNVGITIWNNIVDGFKKGLETANAITTLGGLLTNEVSKAIQSPEWKNLGHVALITPEVNTKPAIDTSKKAATTISGLKPKVSIQAQANSALQTAQKAIQKINNMKATIHVGVTLGQGNVNTITRQLQSNWGGGKASGYMGTVKRPTLFMAGEGGRQEDISIKPRGSAGGSGSGGIEVNVYVDGVLRPARYDMGARK